MNEDTVGLDPNIFLNLAYVDDEIMGVVYHMVRARAEIYAAFATNPVVPQDFRIYALKRAKMLKGLAEDSVEKLRGESNG